MCGDRSLDWDKFLRGMWTMGTFTYKAYMGLPFCPWGDLDIDTLDYFAEWLETLELWMNIKRKTSWCTQQMRCDHAKGSSIKNHQPSYFSVYDWYCRPPSVMAFICGQLIGIAWILAWGGTLMPGLMLVIVYQVSTFGYSIIGLGLPVDLLLGCIYFGCSQLGISFMADNISDFDPHRDLARILHQAMKYRGATQPRDRVYAVCGILQSFDTPLAPVDYSKTKGQVFSEFFSDILQWSKYCLVYIIDAGTHDEVDIQSWAPNWKTALERSWLPANIYSHRWNDDALAVPYVELANKRLQVRGMVVCKAAFT